MFSERFCNHTQPTSLENRMLDLHQLRDNNNILNQHFVHWATLLASTTSHPENGQIYYK